jgi:CelD/BcsL family acetyltransferase involved in cellulose biosynthesis
MLVNQLHLNCGDDMHFETIQKLSELEALAGEWNALLENSAIHVPFLRYEYLHNWWKTKGGGEWQQGELMVIICRKEGGSLAGIAPLFLTDNRDGDRALMLLGSIEISDYLDFILSPMDLHPFINGLFDYLSSGQLPFWQVLDLYNILDTSPTLPALKQAALSRGWLVNEIPLQKCPVISLAENWEAYLSGIDKKQRHEIRRKLRRSEEHPEKVDWYVVEDGQKLASEMDELFRLMAFEPDKNLFLTDEMRAQMLATAQVAFEGGYLQLAFIEVAGEKGAAYFNFDYLNRIWVYNSGFEPRFKDLSLGWVLLSRLIQWSCENQHQAFDFLRGEEDYKYRFGAVDRQLVRVFIRC